MIGKKIEFSKNITPEMVKTFAELSGDFNPIHVDSNNLKQYGLTNNIAHGLIPVSFVSAGLTELLGDGNVIAKLEFSFVRPVSTDCEIKIQLEIIKEDLRFGKYDVNVKIFNSNEVAIKGKAICINKTKIKGT